ncbi:MULTISPECIES: peptidoglycan DD-metalloendopeptidase family protein [Ramlibacter]|uniref:Peptidoglycan DD-metalloendopeptidase family protein n=1 Tax=Ramlibacter pinisoli TaxID=2682844 RepID=A0A6N8INJ2_9BURK|nr:MULTISPECIES: peptidoglycan DD-metalloendopeptidase family protein [Ramlibacter]MBA2963377.1 peptidoglycan DD-metalloendopeptidase family protein [Ramlibacter sp. CGMCC 1.13660]MVQ28344.1 peptidoglycan DD-metalloendopeptidase family protein [Ramlibacter pinisoli]
MTERSTTLGTFRSGTGALLVLTALVLAGCASKTRAPAPVEDRSGGARPPAATAPAVLADPTRPLPLPGTENAGKPGYYTVRQGDTLIRIALEHGQNWRDVVRWNGLDNPNVIEVGQVLRVQPPEVAVARPVQAASVAATPVPPASSASQPVAAASQPASSASATRTTSTTATGTATTAAPVVAAAAPQPAPQPQTPDDNVSWGWPAPGNTAVLASFDEVKNKGLDIAGKLGDPVLAAADGRVVYAGAGLRGYGNLIILKHNNTYLTAYAHNQTLLVKEDQTVRRGQKIAEMGSSDTDRVKLHFEIRRQGKPVDPVAFLPR